MLDTTIDLTAKNAKSIEQRPKTIPENPRHPRLSSENQPQAEPVTPRSPVSIYSLTLTLAYLQYYTPKQLSRGRFISPVHLRRLAAWTGSPAPQLRTLRRHPPLAAHLALLRAAGLIAFAGGRLTPCPAASAWLHAAPRRQIARLLDALASPQWAGALNRLRLQETLPLDYVAFIRQSLARQQSEPPPAPEPAAWLDAPPDTWLIHLPASLPPWLHFDLRQLGQWEPGAPLACTPLTIAAAARRGCGVPFIQWLLETACRAPLPPRRQNQLRQWARRAHTYQLRPVWLLSTARPEQLQNIARSKRLRAHFSQQIAPRHAIVAPQIAPGLEKWLAARQYPLSRPSEPANQPPPAPPTPTSYQWLGLRLLTDLGQLIPLPCPPPHAELEALPARTPPDEQPRLDALAQQIIAGLRNAIRGRDAFFPAARDVPPGWPDIIRQAIARETDLEIAYQALGDHKPTHRRVTPLRLEQRGSLHYLHAWCCRAETNLTFRLDRISAITAPTP